MPQLESKSWLSQKFRICFGANAGSLPERSKTRTVGGAIETRTASLKLVSSESLNAYETKALERELGCAAKSISNPRERWLPVC